MRLRIGLLFCSALLSFSAQAFDLATQVNTYKNRYGLTSADQKLTDNFGEGYDEMYGTRNVRTVLHGVYYRGGANNKYNKIEKRDNMNPLPQGGLYNLCEQGFSEAIYLYPENFNTAMPVTQCVEGKAPSHVEYKQISGLRVGNEKALLINIWNHIKGVKEGPIYAHCWNGWHASGYVAAITLKQFCGWSGNQARDYWMRNTDGNNVGYQTIENRIRNFQPFQDLNITPYEQSLICP